MKLNQISSHLKMFSDIQQFFNLLFFESPRDFVNQCWLISGNLLVTFLFFFKLLITKLDLFGGMRNCLW